MDLSESSEQDMWATVCPLPHPPTPQPQRHQVSSLVAVPYSPAKTYPVLEKTRTQCLWIWVYISTLPLTIYVTYKLFDCSLHQFTHLEYEDNSIYLIGRLEN